MTGRVVSPEEARERRLSAEEDIAEGDAVISNMVTRDLAFTVEQLHKRIADLQAPADEQLRNCAYYYSFDLTGVGVVDLILSKVAHAGKAYHHTEMWSVEDEYTPISYAQQIQDVADQAAAAIRALGAES